MKTVRIIKNKSTKKLPLILLFVFISLYILFSPVALTVSANEQSKAEEKINANVEELISQLDLDALQEYVNGLSGTSESVVDRLIDYIKGDNFDYTQFHSRLLDVLFKKIRDILPAFACITAITLLSGIISSLKTGSLSGTASDMIILISYIASLLPLIGVLTDCFKSSVSCIQSMQKQMHIVYPLLLTLMATSGGSVSVAVCKPAVAFFSTNIVSIISSVVIPLTITIIAFSMASNLSKELKISKFTSFFKSINKWIIGIFVSVFGIFFTLQGITTASYDGIVRRATKYAIGNGVPIVGGFLSGGFDLAVASSVLIKNSLGNLSIFLMVTVLFEPILLLVATTVLLRFTSAITQPFGDSRISDFLGETADNLHFCTAGLLFTAFLYFLSIMLFVVSSEALF